MDLLLLHSNQRSLRNFKQCLWILIVKYTGQLSWLLLTARGLSLSRVLRLTPRGVEGGGMAVSSRVVLLPSIAEAASMLGSSMIVWSVRDYMYEGVSLKNLCHQALDLHSSPPATLTNNISVLTHGLLSRQLGVLQLFEELIQAVCFSALPPLPQLVWHQRRQAACEHLSSEI